MNLFGGRKKEELIEKSRARVFSLIKDAKSYSNSDRDEYSKILEKAIAFYNRYSERLKIKDLKTLSALEEAVKEFATSGSETIA